MRNIIRAIPFTLTVTIVIAIFGRSTISSAASPPATKQEIHISAPLRELLRAEMREISSGVQAITVALATADWKTMAITSEKIRASYILEKKLSAAQREELESGLPDHFKELDEAFHQRAAKLSTAAANHDYEQVAFQFNRLIESCGGCHSVYATARFPGFVSPKNETHHH